MQENESNHYLSDFLGLPDGRLEYAKSMVAFENTTTDFNPRGFTEAESLELYGLRFDFAAALDKNNKGEMNRHDFENTKVIIAEAEKVIHTAAHARKLAASIS